MGGSRGKGKKRFHRRNSRFQDLTVTIRPSFRLQRSATVRRRVRLTVRATNRPSLHTSVRLINRPIGLLSVKWEALSNEERVKKKKKKNKAQMQAKDAS